MSNIQKLREVLLNGNPMLFLGAGFSYGSKNSCGDMATGDILKREIYNILRLFQVLCKHKKLI